LGKLKSLKKRLGRLLTIEKNTKDTLIGTLLKIILEIKRVQAKCCSDFDGIDIFLLNPQDIDNTIYMIFENVNHLKEFIIKVT
jgi:hypothetical protein